ncbi:hypothetical protein [Haloferax elongans]|uniref:hypothetical protein n=1 Tax=Haloferax elongans TaxID=403191 RepID=UPI000677A70F
MKAVLGDGDDDGTGIRVVDNAGASHGIHVAFDGEITYHECDEVANNPALRTREECERVDQTRRYAQWYVYRERGYDTVPSTENPDRILAALLAVSNLSEYRFEELFGDLEDRLASHYDDSPVDLPFPDADPDDAIIYQQDVYLQPDPTDFDPPVLDQFRGRFEGKSDSPVVPDEGEIVVEDLDALDFGIEAVSGIHVIHNDGEGNEQRSQGEQPLDREPDARVELMTTNPDEVAPFQHFVVSNLACQIRDRFLLMGVKPPAAFQVPGWGSYEGFQCQKFCDLYENYWDTTATITTWEPWNE